MAGEHLPSGERRGVKSDSRWRCPKGQPIAGTKSCQLVGNVYDRRRGGRNCVADREHPVEIEAFQVEMCELDLNVRFPGCVGVSFVTFAGGGTLQEKIVPLSQGAESQNYAGLRSLE